MTALMRNGRDRRSGKPVMGHAMLERVRMFGTRSADYIRASGHSGCIATEVILQATTGRIHDRTRTLRRKSDLLLHRGRRPYMTHMGHWPTFFCCSGEVGLLLSYGSNDPTAVSSSACWSSSRVPPMFGARHCPDVTVID